ncbi:MAG TPA: hypothetical protein DDW17_08060 [Deltaproteobacteria bacterium]|nr:hypothetical protein [Deltaproteobacteria bacterium]
MANSFISPYLRQGRILDIGCGSFPYFLKNTEFAEKYGIDKTVSDMTIEGFKGENIISILEHAGFAEDRIRTGYFELFMNIWAVAYR